MPDGEEHSPVQPKQEDFRECSPASSLDSTGEIDAEGEVEGNVNAPPAAPLKRKGGRKPIYATSEERKQRNRQAQAAFRERRTEYIKQLETTIKRQEDSLHSLQQSHRTAADECLMLRYKNSLLERILLEKGIDVQAELRRKETATTPSRIPPNLPQPVPISRPTARVRHVSRLSSSSTSVGPKTLHSPRTLSNPSSQVSSPIKSPGFDVAGLSVSGFQSSPSVQSIQSRSGVPRTVLPPIAPNSGPLPGSGHWPSPFQSHNEQLGMDEPDMVIRANDEPEQEYGSHADMMDAEEPHDEMPDGPGPYPQIFPQQPFPIAPAGYAIPVSSDDMPQAGPSGFAGQGYDASEPMLDADPFGLSASMHFPTPYTSFPEHTRRK